MDVSLGILYIRVTMDGKSSIISKVGFSRSRVLLTRRKKKHNNREGTGSDEVDPRQDMMGNSNDSRCDEYESI